MPTNCVAVQILIASPSDLNEERLRAKRVVEHWNTVNASRCHVVFLPLMWELQAVPEHGDRPQAIVNKQIVQQADAVAAFFWTRLGTPTGVAESGTVEEVKALIASGKPVSIYFSKRLSDVYKHDHVEFARLREFRDWCSTEGLIDEFSDPDSLATKLDRLLDHLAQRFSTTVISGGYRELEERKKPEPPLAEIQKYMKNATATWHAERNSEPFNTDDGKRILRGIGDAILRTATTVSDPSVMDADAAIALASEARMLERHQTYIDGGVSYRAFWTTGDELIRKANELATAGRLSSANAIDAV
jgi:hypothetical protein